MLLHPGERKVYAEKVSLADGTKRSGTLTLTNLRLVFEEVEVHFLHSSQHRTLLDVPLDRVRNVHVEKPLIQLLSTSVLSVETAKTSHRYASESAETWKGHIVKVRSQYLAGLKTRGAAPGKAGGAVVVNVNQAAAPVAPPKVMFRCRYCQTVFPESEGKCPSCGAKF